MMDTLQPPGRPMRVTSLEVRVAIRTDVREGGRGDRRVRVSNHCRPLAGYGHAVGMRRSPTGVLVRHGAARCGQSCGHRPLARRRCARSQGRRLHKRHELQARRPSGSLRRFRGPVPRAAWQCQWSCTRRRVDSGRSSCVDVVQPGTAGCYWGSQGCPSARRCRAAGRR